MSKKGELKIYSISIILQSITQRSLPISLWRSFRKMLRSLKIKVARSMQTSEPLPQSARRPHFRVAQSQSDSCSETSAASSPCPGQGRRPPILPASAGSALPQRPSQGRPRRPRPAHGSSYVQKTSKLRGQFCGSGSGFRCLCDPGIRIRDGKILDPGYGINFPALQHS
jgi:hypothetical protein